jgi:uncharacterized membrane protein HdeD (DUF308 family)
VASDIVAVSGVALVVLGILAIIAPVASGIVFNMLAGAFLLGAGVVQIMEAFRADSWQHGLVRGLAGLLALVAGGLFLARPVVGVAALSFMLIGWLAVDGCLRLAMGLAMNRGTQGRGWTIVSGIASVFLAFVLLGEMPAVGMTLIGVFVGASLVFSGISRIAIGNGLRTASDFMHPLTTHRAQV